MAVDRFPVEAGHIEMFARAIGDDNPVYREAAVAKASDAGGIIAPPTFVQSSAQFDPDYRLRPKIGQPWFGSGKEATGTPNAGSGGVARGLHAEQHYTYHRHIRPGDVLHASVRDGGAWEKQGRRGGLLKFAETITEYRDENNELVVTARSVSVVTEKAAE